MHKKRKEKRLTYYAKISIIVALTLLLYGLVLDVNNEKRLFDSIDDVRVYGDGNSTISITTSDGSEVVPGNVIISGGNNDKENSSSSSNNSSPSNNSSSPSNNKSGENSNRDSEPHIVTPEEINNNLRKEIQNDYGVIVKYGNETNGYVVGGFSTTPIQNTDMLYDQLNHLKNALSLYPSGFFNEIKNGGIPLSIYLIYSYSNGSITGITDSSYTYAVISIAAAHPFEESFYHESYHYIERYMFKRGANFNTWNSFNPSDFNYGVVDQKLSYTYSQDPTVPFVNDYAQTSGPEDRASTFEYMMSATRASCMNRGTIIHSKANQMALTIDAVLNTVKPNVVEYWERYL